MLRRFDAIRSRRRKHGGAVVLFAVLLLGSACSEPTGVGGGGNGGDPFAAYDHQRTPGASARDLLADDDFGHLVVEIQHVDGFRPSNESLDSLQAFLEARLNKSSGITVRTPQPLQISSQPSYSASQIRSLEETHRTEYTRGDTLAAYVLFLDGEYDGGSNVLGLAYYNTSMAIFQEKIVDNTGGPFEPAPETVEATVMFHEFGHVMGLVANGSPMQFEHQDEPNGRHCDDPDCLMYYAVRTTDFLSKLTGGEIPQLDGNCLDDLQANGGK